MGNVASKKWRENPRVVAIASRLPAAVATELANAAGEGCFPLFEGGGAVFDVGESLLRSAGAEAKRRWFLLTGEPFMECGMRVDLMKRIISYEARD